MNYNNRTCQTCKYKRYEMYSDNQCEHPVHWTSQERGSISLPEEDTCFHYKRSKVDYIFNFFRYIQFKLHQREFRKFEKYKEKFPERFIK